MAEPVALLHLSCQADCEQKHQGDRLPLQLPAEGHISLRTWRYKNDCIGTRSAKVSRVPSTKTQMKASGDLFIQMINTIRKQESSS